MMRMQMISNLSILYLKGSFKSREQPPTRTRTPSHAHTHSSPFSFLFIFFCSYLFSLLSLCASSSEPNQIKSNRIKSNQQTNHLYTAGSRLAKSLAIRCKDCCTAAILICNINCVGIMNVMFRDRVELGLRLLSLQRFKRRNLTTCDVRGDSICYVRS